MAITCVTLTHPYLLCYARDALSSDTICLTAGHRPYAEKYAEDQEAFFKDYAAAHKKLSENGAKWVEGGPVALD